MSSDFGEGYYDGPGGQTQEDVFAIDSPGKYVIRFVHGIKTLNRVWVPVIYSDRETGDEFESWKVITVSNEGDSIFNMLSTKDKEIQKSHGVDKKNVESKFDPQLMFGFLIFNRAEESPILRIGEFKYTVRKRLQELQKEDDPADPSKMAHGLWWFYDCIVSRHVESGWTKYKVDAYKNKFEGKVPVSYRKGIPSNFDPIKKNIFTESEMQAIKDFKSERGVEKLSEFWSTYEIPMTNEQIGEFFTEIPINLSAVDPRRKGKKVFPYKEIESILKEAGFLYQYGPSSSSVSASGAEFDEGEEEGFEESTKEVDEKQDSSKKSLSDSLDQKQEEEFESEESDKQEEFEDNKQNDEEDEW